VSKCGWKAVPELGGTRSKAARAIINSSTGKTDAQKEGAIRETTDKKQK